MIKHTVIFQLKDGTSPVEKNNFFKSVQNSNAIPGVQNLEVLKRTDENGNGGYGIFMEFENEEIYTQYSAHPEHVSFSLCGKCHTDWNSI